MSQIPSSPRSDVLAWCQAHHPIFLAQAANIGLTPAEANAFKGATLNYAGAAGQQEAARIASETATQSANSNYTPMRSLMTRAVAKIRAYAVETNDPRVYTLAQVPPRQDPSTIPPPGRPFEIAVELVNPSGAVQLRWKTNNPRGAQGTSYIIRRRVASTGPFEFIGVTGEKRFVDNTFLAGPDSVQYTVQGQRADSAGAESEIFTVRFGRGGPGLTIVSAQSAAGSGNARLAA